MLTAIGPAQGRHTARLKVSYGAGPKIFLDIRWKHGMGRVVMPKTPTITLPQPAASTPAAS
jgi:hypothetical protein